MKWNPPTNECHFKLSSSLPGVALTRKNKSKSGLSLPTTTKRDCAYSKVEDCRMKALDRAR